MLKSTTPTKVFLKTNQNFLESVCRLCDKEKDAKHMVKLFSAIGTRKNLQQKIDYVLHIKVAEHDCLPQKICKPCESFLDKVWIFIKDAQEHDNNFKKITCTKRGILLSPSSENQTVKRRNSPTISKTLLFDGVTKRTDSISKQLNQSCQKLCNRKVNPSVLYNKDFDSMKNFDCDKLWEEINKHPFLVDILMGVCGKEDSENEEVKLKLSFVYSILMQMRWHELSLFQRINTVQVTNGKCSKEVTINYIFITV